MHPRGQWVSLGYRERERNAGPWPWSSSSPIMHLWATMTIGVHVERGPFLSLHQFCITPHYMTYRITLHCLSIHPRRPHPLPRTLETRRVYLRRFPHKTLNASALTDLALSERANEGASKEDPFVFVMTPAPVNKVCLLTDLCEVIWNPGLWGGRAVSAGRPSAFSSNSSWAGAPRHG